MPFRCARGAYTCNEEPRLDELLAEPVVRLMMARDHVEEAAIRQLAAWVRASRQNPRVLEELEQRRLDQC
jgi:hypothetical protein